MAEKYIFTPRHAKTLYTQSEREELVRILDQATKIKDIPEKVRDIVWKVINIFTWDETDEVAISCWEVTQVRNKIPRDTRRFLQDNANKISELWKTALQFNQSRRHWSWASFRIFLREPWNIIILSIHDLIDVLSAARDSTDATFWDVQKFIKEGMYWKLNSQSFTLSLLILEREENPYIWNLKMLQSRYSSSEYTTNQARLISSIRKKSWFTKWTLRSPYRAWHPKNRRRFKWD